MAVDSVGIYECVRKKKCMLHLELHTFKVTSNEKIVKCSLVCIKLFNTVQMFVSLLNLE